jgi:hypothetical protein
VKTAETAEPRGTLFAPVRGCSWGLGPQPDRRIGAAVPFGSLGRSQRHRCARAHRALAFVPTPAAILTTVSNEALTRLIPPGVTYADIGI